MRKYLDMSKKTFYLCSTNKTSINLKFKVMSKFILVKGCNIKGSENYLGYNLRRYISNKKTASFFMTEVNLKENHFEIFYSNGGSYFSYLRIIHKPKKVLDIFGYSLDDFLNYENVEEFLERVAKHLKVSGNDINVRCSRYFISDFDIEIL